MQAMSEFIGFTEPEGNDSCFPTLSLKERLTGFAICFGLGLLIQFLSMGSLFGILLGKATKFGLLYTLGNLVSLTGIFFLVGPKRQLENMKSDNRKEATLVFVGSMIMTFVSIYWIKSNLLTLIFVIIQFCAYVWYVLSYIPYGRTMCLNCLKGILNRN